MLSIISQVSSFGDDLKKHRKHCAFTIKDKGPRKGREKRCAFPFNFDGKLYKGVCTNDKVINFTIISSFRINFYWLNILIVYFVALFYDIKDPDGLYWCSTRVNRKNRNHIGGKGHWGYCKPGCDIRPDFINNTKVIVKIVVVL